MEYSIQLLVCAECDAELDLVKQAVKGHEHGEKRKEKEGREVSHLSTSFFRRLSRLPGHVVHYC